MPDPTPIRILGINGSRLELGLTSHLLHVALKGARACGAVTETLDLWRLIHAPFDGRLESPAIPTEIEQTLARMRTFDGFVFATPTWWSMPSDLMKIFLSYLTVGDARGFPLQGKVAGVMAVCEEDGAQHAAMLVGNALLHMGVALAPFSGSFFFHKNMVGRSEENWQETDQQLVGRNVVRLATLLRAASDASWLDSPSEEFHA